MTWDEEGAKKKKRKSSTGAADQVVLAGMKDRMESFRDLIFEFRSSLKPALQHNFVECVVKGEDRVSVRTVLQPLAEARWPGEERTAFKMMLNYAPTVDTKDYQVSIIVILAIISLHFAN